MADSTTNVTQIEASQAQKEVTANGLFDAFSPASYGGRHAEACSGLTWGYYGGRWNGDLVANGTLTLDPSTDNYIVVDLATGDIILANDSPLEWYDTGFGRLYKVITGASTVTSWEDHRPSPLQSVAAGGGIVETIVPGAGISVDNTDPANPVVTAAGSVVSALTISSGVVNINCALGDYFTLALNANVTSITFSNLPASGHGASLMIRITQDSTPRTVAWPASFKWAGGSAGAVSTGSGAKDVLAITTFDAGTAWKATLAKAFA